MLYKLVPKADALGILEPCPFLEVAHLERQEKDLEELLADHLLDVLFEDAPLIPIFQERSLQPEADVYALNRSGDLVIFELKSGLACEDAVLQALRYAQDAGRWTYSQLRCRYETYMKRRGMPAPELREAHRDAFGLEEPLQPGEFNRRQHLYVVGSAANEGLISAVDYWKRQGLSVEFVPYRIYDIAEDRYFEFFSPPYDRHSNPGAIKGVLFDTNRTYGENCVWEMLEKHRVAAYGDVKHVVRYLNPRDIVFFYHKGYGVLAAAEVKRGEVKKNGDDEEYRDVKFLTPVPTRGAPIRALSAAQVSEITGKNFYWARTIKVPYLTGEESKRLLKELKCFLEGQSGPQELTECGAGACG